MSEKKSMQDAWPLECRCGPLFLPGREIKSFIQPIASLKHTLHSSGESLSSLIFAYGIFLVSNMVHLGPACQEPRSLNPSPDRR